MLSRNRLAASYAKTKKFILKPVPLRSLAIRLATLFLIRDDFRIALFAKHIA